MACSHPRNLALLLVAAAVPTAPAPLAPPPKPSVKLASKNPKSESTLSSGLPPLPTQLPSCFARIQRRRFLLHLNPQRNPRVPFSEAQQQILLCLLPRRRCPDERTLIDPDFARDCIVGLSDGLTVPFCFDCRSLFTGSTKLVVVAGLAELVSGAISMGIGGFLSAQAESPQSSLQRSRLVDRPSSRSNSAAACFPLLRRKIFGFIPVPSSLFFRPAHNAGLTPFILKLGEGLEPVSTSRLYISALTIGLSYFIGGIIPLLPTSAVTGGEGGFKVTPTVPSQPSQSVVSLLVLHGCSWPARRW
ncbi:uncharacterized protein UTRI_02343 [Ustilago trichophora]|uniref:Uncharacterized protein n=1 Tax=Ustilago trichophora TaxID=86804 RepID=A0A5C3EA63_9BASI|nr:uncharacterized protein UTRI_02343 [Ustilago trichophora]